MSPSLALSFMFFGLFLPSLSVRLSFFQFPLLSLFLSLSVCLSLSQRSISLCCDCVDQVTNNVCLSLSPHSCLLFLSSLSVCLSVCLSVSQSPLLPIFSLSVSQFPPVSFLFYLAVRASVSFFLFFCPSISQFLTPASFSLSVCLLVCFSLSLCLSLPLSQSPLPASLLVRCCIGGMVMVPIADGVCRSGRKGNKAAGCSLSLHPPPPPPPSLRPQPPLPPISITVYRLPVYIVDLSLQL